MQYFENALSDLVAEETKVNEGLKINLPTAQETEKVNEYERMQNKLIEERRFEKYKASGVPEKFWNESFDTYKVEEGTQPANVRDTVWSFAQNPYNRILVLCGNNGCGKSHLASSVIRLYGGEYVTSSMLCIMYDSTYKGKMSREELIEHYSKVKMLVIDECCKYFINEETEKFLLMQIICMRYENNKPTVLVTNADKKAFVNFLGKAVYDRMTEVATTLTFDWESRRKERRVV